MRPPAWLWAWLPISTTRPPLKGDQLSSYISIDRDGTVLAYYGKIDGGQGLGTSIAQIDALSTTSASRLQRTRSSWSTSAGSERLQKVRTSTSARVSPARNANRLVSSPLEKSLD